MLLQNGYKGFYSSNYLPLTPKSVNDIHKRGGTVLGTSRGGHDTKKIVDNIQDRGINQVNMIVHNALIDITLLFGKFFTDILEHLIQVYIIGGDGTQKGAYEIFKVAITGHVVLFVFQRKFRRIRTLCKIAL
jgi:6-phosphofructokinase 1